MNSFQLPNGKIFRYALPADVTVDDLKRIVFHLLPAAIDFDPLRHTEAAVIRRGS